MIMHQIWMWSIALSIVVCVCVALVTFLSPQLVKQELNLWNMSSGSLEGVATHQSCDRIYVAIFKSRPPNSVPPRGEFHLLFFSVFLLLIYADCNRATRENTLCRKTWQPCRDQGIMGIISWLASSTWGHPPHPVTCQLQFMRFVANLLRICCLQSWQQFGIRLIISPVSFTVIYLNDMQTDSHIYSSIHVVLCLSIH